MEVKILYAEDSPDYRYTIQGICQDMGISIVTVADAASAIKELEDDGFTHVWADGLAKDESKIGDWTIIHDRVGDSIPFSLFSTNAYQLREAQTRGIPVYTKYELEKLFKDIGIEL